MGRALRSALSFAKQYGFSIFIITSLGICVLILVLAMVNIARRDPGPRFYRIEVDDQSCVYDDFQEEVVPDTCRPIAPG